MAQDIDLAQNLYFDYENYRTPNLEKQWIKQSDILPLISTIEKNKIFNIVKVGSSGEGRPIYLISYGKGKTKIFLWSQMHGDESTATRALFDIFNFLSASDRYNDLRKFLFNNLTLYFIPMLNPDGAEVFQRRNSIGIDINRDAIRRQSAESQILKSVFDSIKADFGFNLHDQNRYYSAGETFKSAAISFLAPAFDYEKSINPVRLNAIKLIGSLNKLLSVFIPGHIARYSDDFEPRAFGDNFQKWGMSTVLIESGYWKYDEDKQFIRKLNFISLLAAFKSIADKSFDQETTESYESIPFNEEKLMDLVLRGALLEKNGNQIKVDIGINLNENTDEVSNTLYYTGNIEDIGDLSTFYGHNELDLDGHVVVPGKISPEKFFSTDEVSKLNFEELYFSGITDVVLSNSDLLPESTKLPINIITAEKIRSKKILKGKSADLVILKNGKVKYVIINGFIHDPLNKTGQIINGRVIQQ
jgi:hypothetical protein